MKNLFFLSLAFLLVGCSHFDNDKLTSSYGEGGSDYDMVPSMDMDYAVTEEMSRSTGTTGGFVDGVEQKVMKTGSLTLHMEDVRTDVEAIRAQVTAWGGNVTNSSITRLDNSYVANITVEVPSDQFEAAMTGLKEMALTVESEYTNSDNVTEAYMDLEARLNNLKEEEQQYLVILDQAVTVDEILKVTDYLSAVRYEIESIEGQLKYYDSNIDYSTITLYLTEDESISAATDDWRPTGTVREALSDWLAFLQDVANSGIYIVIFGWPFALIGLGLWYGLRNRGGKRRK